MAKPLAFYGLPGAADYLTTQAAIARGGVERNPLGPHAGPAATVVVLAVADIVLQRKGKRWHYRALRLAGGGVLLGIAISNHGKARGLSGKTPGSPPITR